MRLTGVMYGILPAWKPVLTEKEPQSLNKAEDYRTYGMYGLLTRLADGKAVTVGLNEWKKAIDDLTVTDWTFIKFKNTLILQVKKNGTGYTIKHIVLDDKAPAFIRHSPVEQDVTDSELTALITELARRS